MVHKPKGPTEERLALATSDKNWQRKTKDPHNEGFFICRDDDDGDTNSDIMISEVVNALFLTYVASEYLVAEESTSSSSSSLPPHHHRRWSSKIPGAGGRPLIVLQMIFVVILVNIVDRVTGAVDVVNNLLDGFLHLPRVCFAAVAYLVALYVDVSRRVASMTLQKFASRVGVAFCRVLPAYPFLAVVISFIFMFVISLWEALHLPLEWLNAPIYYGTLYGPFAWVYVLVKRRVVEEQTSLPV